MKSTLPAPTLSIAVPVFNEVENLPLLHAAIAKVIDAENIAAEIILVDDGSTYRAFKRTCVEKLKLYRGLHRFIPTLLKMEGFTVTEIPVKSNPRLHGESKYGVWNRLFKSFRDLLAIRWMKNRLLGYRIAIELDRSAAEPANIQSLSA